MTIASKFTTAAASAAILALCAAPASACPRYEKMQNADLEQYLAASVDEKKTEENMSVKPAEKAGKSQKIEIRVMPTSGDASKDAK